MNQSKEFGMQAYMTQEELDQEAERRMMENAMASQRLDSGLPPHPTQYLAIHGKVGCGKSSLAKLIQKTLVDVLADDVRIFSFGDYVKREASQTFGIPLEMFYHHKHAEVVVNFRDEIHGFELPQKLTIRELMQKWGTDYRRTFFGDRYWINKLLEDVKQQSPEWAIVDDLRFRNEAAAIREVGGWKISLRPHDQWTPGPFAAHVSETELDTHGDFDLIYQPSYSDKGLMEVCDSVVQIVTMFPPSLRMIKNKNRSFFFLMT